MASPENVMVEYYSNSLNNSANCNLTAILLWLCASVQRRYAKSSRASGDETSLATRRQKATRMQILVAVALQEIAVVIPFRISAC